MADDFIGIYKKYAPDRFCDDLINLFEHTLNGKKEEYRFCSPLRVDFQILLDQIEDHPLLLTNETNSVLERASTEYRNKYSASLGTMNYSSWRIKLQKTPIGGGFYNWHCEDGDFNLATRVLVWAIYLNDMPEGEGETEFLYYHKRIRPCKGDVVIFPAAFTHTHRGTPPLSTEKYIAPGWWSFTN